MRVLVTGGGTGIGRAVAETVLAHGGQVVVVGRRPKPLESLCAAYPGRAFPLVADLADSSQRQGLVGQAAQRLGGLEGVVHSAGVVVHQPPGNIAEQALREQLEVHLVAPLRLGEEALQVLAPGGAMVFIGSTLAHRPVLTSAVYSAAKAGMEQVMKVLALAGAPKRIRANAVLPGLVETEMIQERLEAQRPALVALHPLGRLGAPMDVAATAWHLLNASWMTGSAVVVDGGLLLRE